MSLLLDNAVTRLQPSFALRILQAVNLLSLISTATTNGMALYLSWAAGPVLANNPTYIAPNIALVNAFWFALHLFQAGFVFYAQFGNERIVHEIVYGAVGWWFFVTNVLLFWWIGALIIEYFLVCAIIMGLITLIQMRVQYVLISRYPLHRLPSEVAGRMLAFVHTPFSMFAAFSWMLLMHFVMLASVVKPMDEIFAKVAVALVAVLAVIGWAGLFGVWTRGNRDGIFALSISWALLAIAIRQSNVIFLTIPASVLSLSMPVTILIIYLKERSRLAQIFWSSSYAVGMELEESLIADEEQ